SAIVNLTSLQIAQRGLLISAPQPMSFSMKKLSPVILATAFILLCAAPARADITVGIAGPLTGSYATFGEQMKKGAEQAVADINAAGGINGEKLILKSVDDACDPKQAVTVANQLVSGGFKYIV